MKRQKAKAEPSNLETFKARHPVGTWLHKKLEGILFGRGNKHNERVAAEIHTLGRATALATAAVLVFGGGGTLLARGFNDEPRGPKGKIQLSNTEADLALDCLREGFNDKAINPATGNKWMKTNCPPELVTLIDDADLEGIVEQRRALLKANGKDPNAETWIQSYDSAGTCFMEIK